MLYCFLFIGTAHDYHNLYCFHYHTLSTFPKKAVACHYPLNECRICMVGAIWISKIFRAIYKCIVDIARVANNVVTAIWYGLIFIRISCFLFSREFLTDQASLCDDQWHHLDLWFFESGGWSMDLDGAQIFIEPDSDAIQLSGNSSLLIGGNYMQGNGKMWNENANISS